MWIPPLTCSYVLNHLDTGLWTERSKLSQRYTASRHDSFHVFMLCFQIKLDMLTEDWSCWRLIRDFNQIRFSQIMNLELFQLFKKYSHRLWFRAGFTTLSSVFGEKCTILAIHRHTEMMRTFLLMWEWFRLSLEDDMLDAYETLSEEFEGDNRLTPELDCFEDTFTWRLTRRNRRC